MPVRRAACNKGARKGRSVGQKGRKGAGKGVRWGGAGGKGGRSRGFLCKIVEKSPVRGADAPVCDASEKILMRGRTFFKKILTNRGGGGKKKIHKK